MGRTLADSLDWAAQGTRMFAEAVDGLDEEQFDAVTPLTGWTRRHLVAHVAANADAIGNLVRWAATGVETPMYASADERAAGIAKGPTMPAAELKSWVTTSAETLDAAMDQLTDEQWQHRVRTAQGRTVPATETPWMRAREVCVHTVDLAVGIGFGDLPHDFNLALCADVRAQRGIDTLPAELADAPLPQVTAWLAGRPTRSPTPPSSAHGYKENSVNNPDVIVVGGGIGGLSAAYSLSRQGLQVRVLERSAAFGEVGAGMQLAPNCTRILDKYGLLDEAKRCGVVPDSMVMRDAVDGTDLTSLDLRDLERRYGYPYLVIHRSDLHGMFLRACEGAGVDLVTEANAIAYDNTNNGARVTLASGAVHEAAAVIAADGLHSVARKMLVDDQPVSSAYVAYRGTVPAENERVQGVDLSEVVVYVGPRRHFVHYGLRGGEMLNQVAVFESPKARAGEEDWGTPDELDTAFEGSCDFVRDGLPHMWRDKWWRMFDRDPIMTWVHGRIALLGDSAHPPLQYIAQGAIMAIEDGWVLGEHVGRALKTSQQQADSPVDWDVALAAYDAVRPEHCRRVVTTSRKWGELWHLDGAARERRNALLRAREVHDYSFVDWLYGPTALEPSDEPEMFRPIALEQPESAAV